MRTVWLAGLLAVCISASAKAIPDLICREGHVVQVDPKTLKTSEYDSTTIYRFKAGGLYVIPRDRKEYLYNSVSEVSLLRYVSAHKTILFEDMDFRSAILVHSYIDNVTTSRAVCDKL